MSLKAKHLKSFTARAAMDLLKSGKKQRSMKYYVFLMKYKSKGKINMSSEKAGRERNEQPDSNGKRHIPFEGIWNFRDLGGYITEDGHRIKWGKLYRSGQLSGLTPKDQADFKALDIGLVCDFRYEGEQRRAPNNIEISSEVNIMSLPIRNGSFRGFFEKLGVEEPGSDDMLAAMKQIYCDFVNEHAQTYAEMFRHILETENGALIHCTAGKDRTGFGSAMILAALGVGRETIMTDYLLSARYFSADIAVSLINRSSEGNRQPVFSMDVLRPVYEVYPEYLLAAFEEIERNFTSVDHFMTEALGVAPQLRQALKDKYLEPRSSGNG